MGMSKTVGLFIRATVGLSKAAHADKSMRRMKAS